VKFEEVNGQLKETRAFRNPTQLTELAEKFKNIKSSHTTLVDLMYNDFSRGMAWGWH
jgi:hypothetical protein